MAIIYYSYTGGSRQMAEAALAGALDAVDNSDEIDIRLIDAREAAANDLLSSDGYIFAFPENLAAIAGEMKAFFDRCYYPCLGKIQGRAYVLLVCAGSDGTNAVQQAERIATGWRLKRAADSVIICTHAQSEEAILAAKNIEEHDLVRCRDIGGLMAAGLSIGVL